MRKGVTLVEVLVASLILVIAISTILWGVVFRQQLLTGSNLRLEAGRVLNQHLEELNRIEDTSTITTYLNNVYTDTIIPAGSNLGKIAYKVKFTKSDVALGNITGTPNLKLRQVTATAEWTYKGKNEQMNIVTRSKF